MITMIRFALLFLLTPSAKGSSTPWYPVMVPMQTEGSQHRHTTHIVTHPIVHTRVVTIEDDDDDHHDDDYDHFGDDHKTTYGQYSERDPNDDTTTSRTQTWTYDDRNHGGHNYEDDNGDDKGQDDIFDYNVHSQPEAIRYSMLLSESPWKPLTGRMPTRPLYRYRNNNNVKIYPPKLHVHRKIVRPPRTDDDVIPNGYLPLKYLGMDEVRVAKVVNQAINEIERDMQAATHHKPSRPRYPTGIQDVIGLSTVKLPVTPSISVLKPLSPIYHGAVLYDDMITPPKSRYVHTSPNYLKNYQTGRDRYRKENLKLNVECQCYAPY